MTLTRQFGETDAHFKARSRLVIHHLDDRRVNKVVAAGRKALNTYGPMDALAAIELVLSEEAS